jgi:hypothetical protein
MHVSKVKFKTKNVNVKVKVHLVDRPTGGAEA